MFVKEFMERALQLSAKAFATPGTEPFGAVVVLDGKVVGEGWNHAMAHFDPTSHGEIEAIRDACKRLRRVELVGCDLYSSCEPCSLCVAAMKIAGIRKMYYAVSLKQSTEVFATVPTTARRRIDAEALRLEVGAPLPSRQMPAEQRMASEALKILEEWISARKSAPSIAGNKPAKRFEGS